MHYSHVAVATLLPLLAFAQDSGTITDTADQPGETINGGLNDSNGGTQCPGVLYNNEYCCVGGQLTLSTCPGWPICTGPGTVDTATQTESCVTRIPVTASDYSALISSYSESLNGGAATTAQGSGGSGAAETSDASSSGSASSNGGSGGGSSATAASGSGSGSGSSSSSGNAAAVAPTAGVLGVGGVAPMGVLAGGVLGLAALL